MSNRTDFNCVLFAELLGSQKLTDKIGPTEAQRALDRARNRIMRSVDAHHGHALLDRADRLIASFKRADDAAQAASDMHEKVQRLPPVSGITIGLKIGLHCGELVSGNEPSGLAVELAGRLAETAEPGQALMTGELALHLTEGVKALASSVRDRNVRHDGMDIPLYELTSQIGPDSVPPSSSAGTDTSRARLVLRHRGVAHIVTESRPILLMGREEGNDIVILDRRASRHHARIEWRHGHFYVIDQSSNGTFVAPEDEAEIMLKREECALPTLGRVGCGFSCEEDSQGEMVSFEIRQG
ncbi:FHA domain-containing protein [Niveibacterium sp. 24ML]|uniref:FHA domain-containing protein n=1 Tax=Niveibacterium sp. 24ML TaxID=2985512 RepID=UPI0022717634|nr:FHA domain-containing protein [Niveibacterium sp. 24ML]MCX9156247.1 FHA domain-containing protein [Niveibacterium sp. 24ML]